MSLTIKVPAHSHASGGGNSFKTLRRKLRKLMLMEPLYVQVPCRVGKHDGRIADETVSIANFKAVFQYLLEHHRDLVYGTASRETVVRFWHQHES